MITIRDPVWFKRGLICCLALVLVNHTENLVRRRANAARADALNINVQSEGSMIGHNSIGIDENSLTSSGGERFLHFSTLGQWQFARDTPVPCPKYLQNLSGRQFASVGFMYPLEPGDHIKTFCLLRSTQTCCYGPRPQYNQYILVETKTPVAFERLTPILVRGKFFIDPKPDDGYIYRMEADGVTPIDEDAPDIDPVKASGQAHLPLFDYAPLTAMGGDKAPRQVSPTLSALSGKTVVIAGYCVHRTRKAPVRIMLEKSWWDGVAQGEPPTIFNSVVVHPADNDQIPPLWKPFQTFTGELQVTANPANWKREGVVQLRNAHLGVPGVTPAHVVHNELLVPWYAEALLFSVVMFRSLGTGPKRNGRQG